MRLPFGSITNTVRQADIPSSNDYIFVKASNPENTSFTEESLAEIEKRQFMKPIYLDNARLHFNKLKTELTAHRHILRNDQRTNLMFISQPSLSDLLSISQPLTDQEKTFVRQYMHVCNMGVADYDEEILDVETHILRLHDEQDNFLKTAVPADHLDLIKEYEQQIQHLESHIVCLRKEQMTYHAAADRWRKTMPPVYSLPSKLIQKICLACVDGPRNPTLSFSDAPFSLTQISSVFRSISLSTPSLWARLHIDLFRLVLSARKNPYNVLTWFDAIHRWLLLSNKLPLSISVVDSMSRVADVNATMTYDLISNLLRAFAGQWRHMEFRNLDKIFVKPLRCLSTPLLHSLLLNNVPDAKDLCGAPALRNLLLYWIDGVSTVDIAGLQTSCKTLTSLNIGCYSGTLTCDQILHLLTHATSLVDCHLETNAGAILYAGQVHLPHLVALSVKEKSPEWQDGGSVLGYINAPNLKRLELSGQGHAGRERSLGYMTYRSPKLTELYLKYAVSPDDLLVALLHCHYLKVLHIGRADEDTAYTAVVKYFFERLTSKSKKNRICRRLEVLRCNIYLEILRWDDILALRMSRTLKEVRLHIFYVQSGQSVLRVVSLENGSDTYFFNASTMLPKEMITLDAPSPPCTPRISVDSPRDAKNITLATRAERQSALAAAAKLRKESGQSLFVGRRRRA